MRNRRRLVGAGAFPQRARHAGHLKSPPTDLAYFDPGDNRRIAYRYREP